MPDFVFGDIPTQSILLLTPVLIHSLPLLPLAPSKTHHTGSQSAPARAASTSRWLLCSKLFSLSSQARTHCLGEGDSFVGSARGQVTPEPGTWSRLAPPRDNLCSTLLRLLRSLDIPASLLGATLLFSWNSLSPLSPFQVLSRKPCLPSILNSKS